MPRASLSPARTSGCLPSNLRKEVTLAVSLPGYPQRDEFNDLWMAWHKLPDASPGSPGAGGPRPGEPGPPPKIDPPATSDHNGRILLEGIGADRLVLALIEGPGIETQPAIIVTRPGPAIPVPGKGGLIVHGAGFKHVALRSRAIEGVVRDGKTGQPIKGVSIRAAATLSFTGLINYVRTITDAGGRYRLMGIAEGAEDRLVAIPPAESAYLSITESITVAAGNAPAPLDLTLKNGVWIQGRVIDANTGEPLDADVEYHAFDDNPHLGPNRAYEMNGTRTATDGSFRLLGLPGRGFVAAKTFDGRFVRGVGLAALFKTRNTQEMIHTVYPAFFNADEVKVVVGIDPPEEAVNVACELKAATGRTRRGTVLDPDGEQLAGCVACGRNASWSTGASSATALFLVTALGPLEQRGVVFRHEGRKLIGTLVVDGDGDRPLSVSLRPWASVTGRVVGDDGKPRTDVAITLHHDPYPEHALGGTPRQPSSRFNLDEDGRFRIDALAAGIKYDLRVFDPRIGIVGYVAQELTVEAGKSKDLGALKVIDTTH